MAKKAVPKAPPTPTAQDALHLAQEYAQLREQRLEKQRAVDDLAENEKNMKKQLMDLLQALKIDAVGDEEKIYALVKGEEPTITDWPQFYQHIRKTGEFELLYRRVNPASVKERWELGKQVPGVGKFPTLNLSVTRNKGA